MHGTGPVSAWVQRFSHLVPAGARVLDVACGAGRHSLWFAARGSHVMAVDRDEAALAHLNEATSELTGSGSVSTRCADIENGPWPFTGEQFDAIVMTNYLWRPLWPHLLNSLKPGGALIVETFALGHGRLGRPRNPDFLLRPGELVDAVQGLHVLAFEDGLLSDPPQRVQRVLACRPVSPDPESRGDWPLNLG